MRHELELLQKVLQLCIQSFYDLRNGSFHVASPHTHMAKAPMPLPLSLLARWHWHLFIQLQLCDTGGGGIAHCLLWLGVAGLTKLNLHLVQDSGFHKSPLDGLRGLQAKHKAQSLPFWCLPSRDWSSGRHSVSYPHCLTSLPQVCPMAF